MTVVRWSNVLLNDLAVGDVVVMPGEVEYVVTQDGDDYTLFDADGHQHPNISWCNELRALRNMIALVGGW